MTDHMRHWLVLSKTDPAHTKAFQRAGGFRGTAIKPIWVAKNLTEHFGPFGIGWGCDRPEFTQVNAGDEILVFCTLSCWYIDGERRAVVYGIGGDKIAVKRKDGRIDTDDEAFKKAFTDALGNAYKNVGSGADVHMGLFDDNKYVAAARDEFSHDEKTLPKAKSRDIFKKLEAELREAAGESLSALRAWMADGVDQVKVMHEDFQDQLRLQAQEAIIDWKRKEAQPVEDEPEPTEVEKVVADAVVNTGGVVFNHKIREAMETDAAKKPAKGTTVVPSPKRVMEAEIAAQQAKPEPSKPTLVEADPLDLPNFLDRRKGTFNEHAWQIEVGRRVATAASTDDLVAIQSEICTPNRRSVSEASWEWHVGIIRDRMAALAKPAEPTFDAAAWLRDVEGACLGAEDTATLEKVKNGVLMPGRGKAPQAIWEAAVLIYKKSVDRVTSTDILSAG